MTAAATGRELGMPKSTALEISAICGAFILLALWGIVWDIKSGLLTSSIDGIMLLFVCAMMAGIFFLIVIMELTKAGIIPIPVFLRPAPKPAAAAKAAAAPAAKAPVATAGAPATAATKPAAPAGATPKPVAPAAAGVPKPASPAAVTPGAPPAAPPTAPRPAAPAPVVTSAPEPAPAKPATTAPAVPPTVPEK